MAETDQAVYEDNADHLLRGSKVALEILTEVNLLDLMAFHLNLYYFLGLYDAAT